MKIQVFTGRPPFHPIRQDSSVLLQIVQGNRPPRPTIDECRGRKIPDNLWYLITTCWDQDSSRRPSSTAVELMLPAGNAHLRMPPQKSLSPPTTPFLGSGTAHDDRAHPSCCATTSPDGEQFMDHVTKHHIPAALEDRVSIPVTADDVPQILRKKPRRKRYGHFLPCDDFYS
jgi:hypothetical protein